MQTRYNWLAYGTAGLIALLLAAQPFNVAVAHGEMDAEHLKEFHRHLDDYEEEVEEIVGEIRAVADARAQGDETAPAMDELMEHWEEAGVHAAIETKASVTYPDIWQTLAAFRQAVESKRGAETVSAAANDLEAALWQGYGALRLAASQVGN
jgi:hypothetical protein